jgi:hypothetical protein
MAIFHSAIQTLAQGKQKINKKHSHSVTGWHYCGVTTHVKHGLVSRRLNKIVE